MATRVHTEPDWHHTALPFHPIHLHPCASHTQGHTGVPHTSPYHTSPIPGSCIHKFFIHPWGPSHNGQPILGVPHTVHTGHTPGMSLTAPRQAISFLTPYELKEESSHPNRPQTQVSKVIELQPKSQAGWLLSPPATHVSAVLLITVDLLILALLWWKSLLCPFLFPYLRQKWCRLLLSSKTACLSWLTQNTPYSSNYCIIWTIFYRLFTRFDQAPICLK